MALCALPLVINDVPWNLIQVNQSGSVGLGGINARPDVKLVQGLLNALPATLGGPETKLAFDGVSGPRTVGAIRRFQTSQRLRADGLISPGRVTIKTLVPLLRDRQLLPNGLSGIAQPSARIRQALTGGQVSVLPPMGFLSPTPWKFNGSAGISVSVAVFGAVTGKLFVMNDALPNTSQALSFMGVGVGVSVAPANFSFSTPAMWSAGTRIIRFATGINKPFTQLSDFGGGAIMLSIGSSLYPGPLGKGLSAAIVGFGSASIANYYLGRAGGAMVGVQTQTADQGLSVFLLTIG